ncbi:unnamed protein product [Adineta ricciae]|uniref:Uncharacterized protein n=1 Tax=Adineta ricciae TaxID=249248 RepID=A0A814IYD8_ADIRI|nr:unnamed protein product [Adineta ricciae]
MKTRFTYDLLCKDMTIHIIRTRLLDIAYVIFGQKTHVKLNKIDSFFLLHHQMTTAPSSFYSIDFPIDFHTTIHSSNKSNN